MTECPILLKVSFICVFSGYCRTILLFPRPYIGLLQTESILLCQKEKMKLFFVFLHLGFCLNPYSRSKLIKNYQALVSENPYSAL